MALSKASQCWSEVPTILEQTRKQIGFENLQVYHCVYILDKLKQLIPKASTDNFKAMCKFKSYFRSKFRMTDLLEIKQFIRIKI